MRLIVVSLLFFAATASAFTAEQPNLLQTISAADFDENRVLSNAEMRADLDLYSFAMTHAYAGCHFAPKRGCNKLLNLYKNNPAGITTAGQFVEYLYANAALVRDFHFGVHNPLRKDPDGSISQRPQEVRPGVGVGPNFGTASVEWELNWYSKKVPVISIHYFDQPSAHSWDGFLDTVKTLTTTSSVIVFDLRGNTGGNDEMGANLTRLLLDVPDSSEAPSLIGRGTLLQNQFSLEVFLNILNLKLKSDPSYQQADDLFNSKLAAAQAGTLPLTEVHRLPSRVRAGPKAYTGSVFVLMDRSTGSSGEGTVGMLARLPNAKTVGENSKGELQFSNTGVLELPNSKVIVIMGISYNEYRDGRVRETIGLAPQIRVPDGKDALSYLMTRIKLYL